MMLPPWCTWPELDVIQLLPASYPRAGIVLAVRGRAEPGGDFVVSDVVWPGLAPQPERPLMDTDKYVALVSGLQLANRKADMMQVGDDQSCFAKEPCDLNAHCLFMACAVRARMHGHKLRPAWWCCGAGSSKY